MNIYIGLGSFLLCVLLLIFCLPSCFPVDLYLSPVETWCHNLNYYIPDEDGVTKEFTAENMTRIRK